MKFASLKKSDQTPNRSNRNVEYSFCAKDHFLTILVISILLVIALFGYKFWLFTEMMQSIMRMQMEDNQNMEALLSNIHGTNISQLYNNIANVFENHMTKMEHSLDMSIENLQSDVEILSLWAGIITIVFLIFSIYSIFRTDEMLVRANNTLQEILQTKEQASNVVDDLKKEQTNVLTRLSERITAIDNRIQILEKRAVYLDTQKEDANDSFEDEKETIEDEVATEKSNKQLPPTPPTPHCHPKESGGERH